MSDQDYKDGVRAAISYHAAHGYGYVKNIRGEDAIKMHLPVVTEYLTQVSSPLPKPREDWIKGFNEEQANILAEMSTHESTET